MITIRLLAVCLVFSGVAFAADEQPPLPQDVRDYIEKRIGCNRLGGEDYSDPSRGRAMAQQLRECGYGDMNGVPLSTATVTTVDTVEKRLRKKYQKNPTILKEIDSARHQLP